MKLINIGIAGCLGRMGKELVRKSINDSRINFVGGFERKTHELINKKLSEVLNCETNQIVNDNPEEVFNNSDVVIDFSIPECSRTNIEFAEKTQTPLVIGTTGLTQEINDKINDVSNRVAILQSSNMSLAVNLLFKLTQQSASVLDDVNYDIEISETHHKHKIDAPSGTAITLGEFASKGRKEILMILRHMIILTVLKNEKLEILDFQ